MRTFLIFLGIVTAVRGHGSDIFFYFRVHDTQIHFFIVQKPFLYGKEHINYVVHILNCLVASWQHMQDSLFTMTESCLFGQQMTGKHLPC